MTDHRTPIERSMNDKILNILKGDGEGDGLTLTPSEATAFKLMMGRCTSGRSIRMLSSSSRSRSTWR